MFGVVKASDLRLVTVFYLKSGWEQYIVSVKDLPKFVKATVRLHHKPGINPHNNVEASKIGAITTRSMKVRGPYWWTTPDLMENDDQKGAKFYGWDSTEEVLWQRDEGFDLRKAQASFWEKSHGYALLHM